jgi:putative membrane protein
VPDIFVPENKIQNMQHKYLIPAVLFTASAFLFSCGDAGNKSEDPMKVAEKHNDEKFDNEKEKTADFMVYAADLNMQEIQLGELAQGRGYDPEVKKMAKMMIEDHTKALTELKTLAAERTITLPETVSDESKKDCDKLGKKDRHDFDKEYADMMVDGHKDALKRFEKEAEEGADEQVRTWAFKMLPSLRSHLDHALAIQDKKDGKGDTAVVVRNIDDDKADKKDRDAHERDDHKDHDKKADARKSDKAKKDW